MMEKKICAVEANEQSIYSNEKLIIFGIDGVFYQPDTFSADFHKLTLEVISERSGVELEVIERKTETKKISQIINRYGLQADNVALEAEKRLDPQAHLVKNNDLINLLYELKQRYRICIVSNKPRVFIQRVMEQLEIIDPLFDLLIIANDLGRYVRKNQAIEETMRAFSNINPNNMIYITGRAEYQLDNVLNTLDIDNGMQVEGPQDLVASLPGYLSEIEEEVSQESLNFF
jgi:FMN phosphatase YigB (HAD superfamily)